MKKLAIALLLILGCSVSYAQSNLSIEKLWSLGRVAYQGISNDGATLYYSVSVPNIAENKSKTTNYAIPLIGGKAIEIATIPGKVEISIEKGGDNTKVSPDGALSTPFCIISPLASIN